MGDGDTEVLPPSGDERATQSIVINQFFQLVNKNNTLPDGEALARYTHEDKEWIKERVNYEQEQRLMLFNKYMDHKHALEVADNDHEHQNTRHRQWGAFTIVGGAIIAAAILMYLKVGFLALGLPAIVLIPGVAAGITGFITDKLKDSAKDKSDSTPSSKT